MKKPTDEMKVCTKCVTSPRFKKWIRTMGERGRCDIVGEHGGRSRVVSVGDLARYVDEIFREEYQSGSEYSFYDFDSDGREFGQMGSSLLDIITDELLCDEGLANKIIENLPDFSGRDIAKGAEPFYDYLGNYEKIADVEARSRAESDEFWYTVRFSLQWEDFCKHVTYENRYFMAKKLLDKLFGKPSEYEGCGPVNPIYILRAPLKIYRARVIDASFTEEILRANPAKEIGAPPRDRATAGRMNVEFIPAFYGAFSEQTAVAETRPDIGDEIAIGEFVLKTDVKVFDFTVFAVPRFGGRGVDHTRYDFIDQLEREISRRVRSHERRREYIPTQIVAEYLKLHFGCDAIIYHSAVVSARSEENRNIVFLPRLDSFVGCADEILNFSSFRVLEVGDVSYKLTETFPNIDF